MPPAHLIETLSPLQRLALAYAPASTRQPLLALLALDTRLAGILRASREPMLAQLRFAWWREQLAAGSGPASTGDPLLAALNAWPAARSVLSGLVEGWEAMTGDVPLPASAFLSLAEARGAAFAALVDTPEAGAAALRMGRNWALADIASGLSNPQERAAALELTRAQDWRWARLPRKLRPLAVLHGLAAHRIMNDAQAAHLSPAAMLRAVRIGLLGR